MGKLGGKTKMKQTQKDWFLFLLKNKCSNIFIAKNKMEEKKI